MLKINGYYEAPEESVKRKILLDNLSLLPKARIDKKSEKAFPDGKAVCLNFDTRKGTF